MPLNHPPQVVRESGLLGESGWVSVDRHTLETRFPGVYAIGDVVAIPVALGKPLPKAGVFAHGTARIGRRVELLEGSAEEIPLEPKSIDTMVTTWTPCSIPDVTGALREMRRDRSH